MFPLDESIVVFFNIFFLLFDFDLQMKMDGL